jgi:hypothetical protein
MKKIIFAVFLLSVISADLAFGHKLINHDGNHRDFDSALIIPDHKISWAIYDNLGTNESKFYTFEAKKGDSFYASIVIPKIQGLENYAPSLLLAGENKIILEKVIYEKGFPGEEFYEPFGQVTYWERQELRTEIPQDGKYFIIVIDEKNQEGKYSLAVGTKEDFSGENMITLLPKAWLDTKLFVNDYNSIVIVFVIAFMMFTIPIFFIFKKRKMQIKA